jgi:hypothetical protein
VEITRRLNQKNINDRNNRVQEKAVQKDPFGFRAGDDLSQQIELEGNDEQAFHIVKEDVVDVVVSGVCGGGFQQKVDQQENGEIFHVPFGTLLEKNGKAGEKSNQCRNGANKKEIVGDVVHHAKIHKAALLSQHGFRTVTVMENYLDDFHCVVFANNQGSLTKAAATTERRAEDATGKRYDLGLSVLIGIKLFAGAVGSIAAAVADHHQGLTAFEFRLGCILGIEYSKMKTNAISTIGFYRSEKRFYFFDREPYAERISFAHAVRVCGPSFLFVRRDKGVYFLFGD